MNRTVGFSTPVYRYGVLEPALGAALGVGATASQGAMRGRLKRFSTLDLPGGGPGKGARRLYSWEQALQLLIALLRADAGLDPVVIVPAIKHVWARRSIQENVKRVTGKEALGTPSAPANPIMIMLRLQATKPWITGEPKDVVPWIAVFPRTDLKAKARYAKHGFKDESDIAVMMLERDEPGWDAFRNLTAAAHTLQTALHAKDPT
jgi:hypothetical protein